MVNSDRTVPIHVHDMVVRKWTARSLECNALRETVAELTTRLDQIERDRREPDKVLCALQRARAAIDRVALDENQSTEEDHG